MPSTRLNRAARIAIAVAITAVALAIAPPARAGDIDYKGWFVALDAALTQPNGLDQHYATEVDPTTHAQKFLFMDNGSGFSGQGDIGYSWGQLGSLSLSYWTFDNDDSLSQSVNGVYVYPTVFGGYAYNNGGSYGLGYTLYFPVTYEVTSKVKANKLDLEYSRPMEAGEHFTVTWLAGLRSVTWEEDLKFDGADAYPGYPTRYVQTRHIKSDGVGLKVGAVFDFGMTKHFSLQGRMAFSFLQGTSEATTTQDAYALGNPVPNSDILTVSQDHVSGEVRDYDLRAVWSWKTVDFYVGYGGSTWEGLVKDPTGDMVNFPATKADGLDRSSMSFDSAHVGVVFRLGGG